MRECHGRRAVAYPNSIAEKGVRPLFQLIDGQLDLRIELVARHVFQQRVSQLPRDRTLLEIAF